MEVYLIRVIADDERRGGGEKETTGTDNETDTSDLSGSLRGWCSRMSYEANALLRQ